MSTAINPDHEAHFHLMILYDWKTSVTAERIAYHVQKIAALKARGVPGLLDVRIGARECDSGRDAAQWDDGALLLFRSHQDYKDFGGSAAHDEVANELVIDLERIFYVGFTA